MKWQIITPKEPEPAHLNAYALLPEKYVWYTVQQMPDETFAVVRHTELRRFIDDVATGINIAEEDKIAELAKQEDKGDRCLRSVKLPSAQLTAARFCRGHFLRWWPTGVS